MMAFSDTKRDMIAGPGASGKERPVMVCHQLDAFVLASACSLFQEGSHLTSIFSKPEKVMTSTLIICLSCRKNSWQWRITCKPLLKIINRLENSAVSRCSGACPAISALGEWRQKD